MLKEGSQHRDPVRVFSVIKKGPRVLNTVVKWSSMLASTAMNVF